MRSIILILPLFIILFFTFINNIYALPNITSIIDQKYIHYYDGSDSHGIRARLCLNEWPDDNYVYVVYRKYKGGSSYENRVYKYDRNFNLIDEYDYGNNDDYMGSPRQCYTGPRASYTLDDSLVYNSYICSEFFTSDLDLYHDKCSPASAPYNCGKFDSEIVEDGTFVIPAVCNSNKLYLLHIGWSYGYSGPYTFSQDIEDIKVSLYNFNNSNDKILLAILLSNENVKLFTYSFSDGLQLLKTFDSISKLLSIYSDKNSIYMLFYDTNNNLLLYEKTLSSENIYTIDNISENLDFCRMSSFYINDTYPVLFLLCYSNDNHKYYFYTLSVAKTVIIKKEFNGGTHNYPNNRDLYYFSYIYTKKINNNTVDVFFSYYSPYYYEYLNQYSYIYLYRYTIELGKDALKHIIITSKNSITSKVNRVNLSFTINNIGVMNITSFYTIYVDNNLLFNYTFNIHAKSYINITLPINFNKEGEHLITINVYDPVLDDYVIKNITVILDLYDFNVTYSNYIVYNNTKYLSLLKYNISVRCGVLDHEITLDTWYGKQYTILCDNTTKVITDEFIPQAEGQFSTWFYLNAVDTNDNRYFGNDTFVADLNPPSIFLNTSSIKSYEGFKPNLTFAITFRANDAISPILSCQILYNDSVIYFNSSYVNNTDLSLPINITKNNTIKAICTDLVGHTYDIADVIYKYIWNISVIGPKPYNIKVIYQSANESFKSNLSQGYLILNNKPEYFYAYAYRGLFKSNVHYDPETDTIENVTLTLDPQFTIQYQPYILRQGVGSLLINITNIEEPPITINITTSEGLQVLFPGKNSYTCESTPCIITVPYGVTFNVNSSRNDFHDNLTGKNWYGPFTITINMSGYVTSYDVDIIEYKWGDKIVELQPISCDGNVWSNVGNYEVRWYRCFYNFTMFKKCYVIAYYKVVHNCGSSSCYINREYAESLMAYYNNTEIDYGSSYYGVEVYDDYEEAEADVYSVYAFEPLPGIGYIKLQTRKIYNQEVWIAEGFNMRLLCISTRSNYDEYKFNINFNSNNNYIEKQFYTSEPYDAIAIITYNNIYYSGGSWETTRGEIDSCIYINNNKLGCTFSRNTWSEYTGSGTTALAYYNILKYLYTNSYNKLSVAVSGGSVESSDWSTISDDFSVIVLSYPKQESISIDGLIGLILPVGTDKVYNITIKNTADHTLYNITIEYYYPDYLIEIVNPITHIDKLNPGEEVTIPLHIITKVDHPTEYFTISIWAYANNYEWGVKHIRTRIIEKKDVLIKLECPTSVPVGARFDIRVKYMLREGTVLKYPLVTVDWNGTAFAWKFGYLAYQEQCVDETSLIITYPGTRVDIPVLSHSFWESGHKLNLNDYTIEKYELRVGPVENLQDETIWMAIFAGYPDNQIFFGQLTPDAQISKSIDLKPYIPIVTVDTWIPIWISVEPSKQLGSYACRMGTARGAEPTIEVILQYKKNGPDAFQPLGEYWFKTGKTVNNGEWSDEYVFTAIAPYTPGKYNITAFVCDTIDSMSCWWESCTISVEETTSLITSLRFNDIYEYRVGESAIISGRFEATNVGSSTIIGPVYKTITIPYAENLKITDISTGKVIFEADRWSGPVSIPISNIGPGETKVYEIKYEMPTVKVVDTKEYFVIEKGEKTNVKQITLQSVAPTILHRVIYDDIINGKVTRVTINDKEVQFKQVGNTVEIDCGTFGVGEKKLLRIYYKSEVPPVIKETAKVGKSVADFIKDNAVWVLGGLAALLFIIFLVM